MTDIRNLKGEIASSGRRSLLKATPMGSFSNFFHTAEVYARTRSN
jgi:hypothetical protein